MTMNTKNKIAIISSLLGASAVLLGAFGAHYLKTKMSPASLEVYKTSNFYHFIHTILLFTLSSQNPKNKYACFFLLIGILLFCGSLYVLSITGIKWLGAITPVGGIFLTLGWLCIALKCLKK